MVFMKLGGNDEARLIDEQRVTLFWNKVRITKDDTCWEWQACRQRNGGYGLFWDGTRLVLSHRFSWLAVHGDYPNSWVLHRCDNPPCVKPSHLFLGTALDNHTDMATKGRRAPTDGENSRMTRFTREQIADVRARWARGETQTSIALEYGVHQTTIHYIVKGKTWH